MASQSGFFGTAPPPLIAAREVPLQVVERQELKLAGVIGSELSAPLAAMQYVLHEFTRTRSINRSQIMLLESSLEAARSVAMHSQQIARLAGGRLRQSHERLKLDELLRDALQQRSTVFHQRGIEVYQSLKPVEVIVDAGLLSSLIDTAIDWAMSVGHRLVVTLEMKNWPEHGMLLIKASDSVGGGASGEGQPESDTLTWYLFTEIAKAMGVSIDRVTSTNESSLMVEFPRTVKRLEGLTAVEVDTGGDSMNSESKPLAGHRVLVITDDERLRFDINLVCRSMGLVADAVPNTKQGVRFCELDAPHLVIIDQRVRDHIFEELRQDLRKTDPNFPFIEIASESNTLEMAGWMSDSMTRVSRDSLRAQLASILVMELAKVM